MAQSRRIAPGLLTRDAERLGFRFDGRALHGLAGDTLASALLANGVQQVGRSFKYHRPRGIVALGADEPCALVDVLSSAGREPNPLATTLELPEGLDAPSQNRWPSLRFDALAINNALSRFLPAGFYYKTFMSPSWAWERIYEPLIRRAAGLGRLDAVVGEHSAPAETVHDHADVLVVGAGAAGLAAARRLGADGLRVLLCDQDVTLGGGTLLDRRWDSWRDTVLRELATRASVRALPRTAIVGAYGHGVFGAIETLAAAERAAFGGLRERLRIIRARRVVIATGAVERLIAFPGNDIPGVMLAGAALGYLRRYGVAVGERPALFVNNDEAYQTAFALADAGVRCAGVIDVRNDSDAAERARARGLDVQGGSVVVSVAGSRGVRGIRITNLTGNRPRALATDCLLMSGGHSPATALASQLGAPTPWHEEIAAFTSGLDPRSGRAAGGARGRVGLAAAALDGAAAAAAIAAELGHAPNPSHSMPDPPPDPSVHAHHAAVGSTRARQSVRRPAERRDDRRRAARAPRRLRTRRAHEALHDPWNGHRPGPHRRPGRQRGARRGTRRPARRRRPAEAAAVRAAGTVRRSGRR